MKKLIISLFGIAILFLSSCTWGGKGGGKIDIASTLENTKGVLVSKK